MWGGWGEVENKSRMTPMGFIPWRFNQMFRPAKERKKTLFSFCIGIARPRAGFVICHSSAGISELLTALSGDPSAAGWGRNSVSLRTLFGRFRPEKNRVTRRGPERPRVESSFVVPAGQRHRRSPAFRTELKKEAMTGETSRSGSTEKASLSPTKVFRDLTIYGDPEALESLLSRLETLLSDGWSRDREREATLWCRPGQSQFCFVRRSSSEVPAIVLLMCPAGRELSVTNIVADRRELSVDDYNAILAEFYLRFLHPPASDAGLRVELSPDEQNLEAVFGYRAAGLLKRFSHCANKASTHPADRRRWMEFQIQLHSRPNRDCDYDLLAKWLIQDGWTVEKTHKLISECEFARELLRAYDERLPGIGAGDRAPTIGAGETELCG